MTHPSSAARLLARLLVVASCATACDDSDSSGAAAGGSGGSGGAGHCDGIPASLPEPWTSTEESPLYDCQCNDVCCDTSFDRCLTVADMDATINPTWKASASPDDYIDGCAPAKAFGGSGCSLKILTALLGSRGGLCCYTFSEGSCCGRPILFPDGARVAETAAREDWS